MARYARSSLTLQPSIVPRVPQRLPQLLGKRQVGARHATGISHDTGISPATGKSGGCPTRYGQAYQEHSDRLRYLAPCQHEIVEQHHSAAVGHVALYTVLDQQLLPRRPREALSSQGPVLDKIRSRAAVGQPCLRLWRIQGAVEMLAFCRVSTRSRAVEQPCLRLSALCHQLEGSRETPDRQLHQLHHVANVRCYAGVGCA